MPLFTQTKYSILCLQIDIAIFSTRPSSLRRGLLYNACFLKIMLSQLIIFFLLLAFWLLLSGHYTVLIVTLGVASAVLVTLLCRRLGMTGTHLHTASVYLRLPAYVVWLTGAIIIANIKVAKCILSPKLPINPAFRRVPMSQQTDLGRLIHANSITLTPGTVSVDLDPDAIKIHTLLQSPDDAAVQQKLDHRVQRLETGTS